MTSDRWRRVERLFHELLDLAPVDRQPALDAVAADDPALADELQRLLVAAASTDVDEAFTAAVETLLVSPPIEAGAKVGTYRVLDEMASGGMGTVYRAVHEETEREVALKIVGDAWSPRDRARLVREYRLIASLDDEPRIARLYEVGLLDDGAPWFAMELVRGASPITDYSVARQLGLVERLRLFRDVCLAVAHAHARPVIHRDLKPSNILVSEAGDVKLLDFGIAAVLADLNRDDERALVGTRSLTPSFAAPEQLQAQPEGVFTDLYVLGRVLYELLTGKRPFDLEGKVAAEVLEVVLTQQVLPPSHRARAGGVYPFERADWRGLDAICLRLLAVEPRHRYASAEGLLADIDRFLETRPVLALTRPPVLYASRQFVARHDGLVAGVAAAAFVVVALSVWYGMQLAAERRETAAQAARTERLLQFMQGLFSGAEPDVGPERQLTVRQLLERGALTADVLTSEPDIRAELTLTLGTLYQELGELDRADGLLRTSLEEKARILAAEDPRRLDGELALAGLRIDQMKLDEAETLARRALATTSRHYAASHPTMIKAGAVLGRALVARGKYDEAIAHLEDVARHLDPSAERTADGSALLTQLANAHSYAGHLDEADRLNRQVLALDRRLRGDRHPTVADDLLNLAAASQARGRYADAEGMTREALGIFRGWYGSDHPETASAARILAAALSSQNKLEEAAVLLEEARTIFARTYREPHRRVGLVLNDLGAVALRRQQFERAIEAFSEALDVFRKVYPDGKSQYISVGLSNLGTVFLETQEYGRAELVLRESVALSRQVLSPTHSNTAISEIKLGRALVKQERYLEATTLLEQGRQSLAKQADPSFSWLRLAREDLMLALERTGRAEEAARVRAEVTAGKTVQQ